jgi:hypothetical protein
LHSSIEGEILLDMTIGSPEKLLDLWAQYHTVGPDGYADSDGEAAREPTAVTAKEICAQPGQMNDICWVNYSVFISGIRYRVGESHIATSQRNLREVYFRPVSEVLERGNLPKHTAMWVGYLTLNDSGERPDHFEELVQLLP